MDTMIMAGERIADHLPADYIEEYRVPPLCGAAWISLSEMARPDLTAFKGCLEPFPVFLNGGSAIVAVPVRQAVDAGYVSHGTQPLPAFRTPDEGHVRAKRQQCDEKNDLGGSRRQSHQRHQDRYAKQRTVVFLTRAHFEFDPDPVFAQTLQQA